jgi:phosphoesterase RecJ-like protein
MGRAQLDRERRFVATWLTEADLHDHGVDIEETEGLIDLVRRTSEAEVCCVLKETPIGVRVSLRAVRDCDVGAIAMRFGGGGHRFAAGFVSDRPIPEVLEAIRAELPGPPAG